MLNRIRGRRSKGKRLIPVPPPLQMMLPSPATESNNPAMAVLVKMNHTVDNLGKREDYLRTRARNELRNAMKSKAGGNLDAAKRSLRRKLILERDAKKLANNLVNLETQILAVESATVSSDVVAAAAAGKAAMDRIAKNLNLDTLGEMMDDVADNMLMTEQANEILGQPLNDVGVAEELERAFSELMVGESESDLLNDKDSINDEDELRNLLDVMPAPPRVVATKPTKKPVVSSPRPVSKVAVIEEPVPVPVAVAPARAPVSVAVAAEVAEPKRVFMMVDYADVAAAPVDVVAPVAIAAADVATPVPATAVAVEEEQEEEEEKEDQPMPEPFGVQRMPSAGSGTMSKLIRRMSGRSTSSAKSMTTTNPKFLPTAPTKKPIARRPVLDDDDDESDSVMIRQLALEMAE